MGDERIIPATLRPDGTVRKQLKVRPGFTPQEDQQIFKGSRLAAKTAPRPIPGTVGLAQQQQSSSTLPSSTSSSSSCPSSSSGVKLSKNQKRNEKKRLQKLLGADSGGGHDEDDNINDDGQSPQPNTSPSAATTITTTIVPTPEIPVEKKIKNLNKKLRQIDDLIEKRAQGEELLPEQLVKIQSKQEIEREIDELMKGCSI